MESGPPWLALPLLPMALQMLLATEVVQALGQLLEPELGLMQTGLARLLVSILAPCCSLLLLVLVLGVLVSVVVSQTGQVSPLFWLNFHSLGGPQPGHILLLLTLNICKALAVFCLQWAGHTLLICPARTWLNMSQKAQKL